MELNDAAQEAEARVPWPLVALCVAAIVAAFALALRYLGTTPFWVDESMTVMPARSIHQYGVPRSPFDNDFMPFQVKWDLWDMGTPLYRYAVAAFTAVFGFSEFTTRGFSLAMGAVCVAALFALVRHQRDTRTALFAATLLATSPSFLVFAREARHFSFVMALSVLALHWAYRTVDAPNSRAGALWFVASVATLLSQTLGYLILPVVGLFALACGVPRFFARRWIGVYAAATACYAAVLFFFWDTLPFFHDVGCASRPAGCQQNPLFYLGVASRLLEPQTTPFAEGFLNALSLAHGLFALGLVVALAEWVRVPERRRSLGLWLIWLLVPLALLTTRDVKFPRYLFIWVMPPLALFSALGLDWLLRRRAIAAAGWPLAAALVAFVVLAPRVAFEPVRPGESDGGRKSHGADADGEVRRRFELAAWDFARDELLAERVDNFEAIKRQAMMVDAIAAPNDAIVTSFDDAGLNYYTGRFVHGFLDSRKTDDELLRLLEETRARGGRVVFMDTLPHWNFCLSAGPELASVDCREKYPRFYAACDGDPGDAQHPCVRLRLF